ncbi:hypothetical protein [Sulfuricella sp. T08]|uniref:hypothetical protein n=1 Tax=Sulfuricella sp. T08 TaxID=1632857 RepID=UPI00131F2A2F|nr:hypothetical protein [Sulfuricella sp. T08]
MYGTAASGMAVVSGSATGCGTAAPGVGWSDGSVARASLAGWANQSVAPTTATLQMAIQRTDFDFFIAASLKAKQQSRGEFSFLRLSSESTSWFHSGIRYERIPMRDGVSLPCCPVDWVMF